MTDILFLLGIVFGAAATLVMPSIGVLEPPENVDVYLFSAYLSSKACFWIPVAVYLNRKERR